MSIKNTLIQNVRMLRKAKGLSQAEFAECIDASHSHIRQVETGNSGYSIELLEKIAAYFDVEVYELFKEQGKAQKEVSAKVAIEVIAEKLGFDIDLRAKNMSLENNLLEKISQLGEKEIDLLNRTVDRMLIAPERKKKAN